MNKQIVWALVVPLLGLLILQCDDKPSQNSTIYVTVGQTFTLAPGQRAVVNRFNFDITLDSIIVETRCQPLLTCINPGVAEAAFTVKGGNSAPHSLNLAVTGEPCEGDQPMILESWNGFGFEMLGLADNCGLHTTRKSTTSPPPFSAILRITINELLWKPLDGAVQIVDYDPASLMLDQFFLDSASVLGDTLSLYTQYGGGCRRHYFSLFMTPSAFAETNPLQADLYLRHDDMDDRCKRDCVGERCIVSQVVRFDLRPIKDRILELHGGTASVMLNFFKYFEGTPGDKIQVEYGG